MRNRIGQLKVLAFSGSAKDTYLLFVSNTLSAFSGFLFTWFIAKGLSVSDFGVFSAANNLIFIIASLTDVGISSGLTNFVARFHEQKNQKKADEYIKAALISRVVVVVVLSLIIVIFRNTVAGTLLATSDSTVSIWVAVISTLLFSWVFFPYVFKAKKQFIYSVYAELSLSFSRVLLVGLFYLGGLTIYKAFGAFAISSVVGLIVCFYLVGLKFLSSKPGRIEYSQLLKFSGWMGVNNVLSSISGRLDIQMLAVLAGATATGIYSIPQRLAFFIGVLASSFVSVLSPRMAAFNDKQKEKQYMIKATLGLVPISLGIILWIIVAEPFILVLFGDKYLEAVPVFRYLVASMIPFLFTVPAVGAIIYAMQKPIYIGTFAIFQIITVFLLNSYFIPVSGAFGPTYTLMIINVISVIYFWTIAIRYYWKKPK